MLKKLTLSNFKSFKQADVDFGQLVIAVGTNASGKSNLRDALRFLHGVGLGYSLAEILGEKYGPGGILQWRGIRGGVREVGFQKNREFTIECTFVPQYLQYKYYLGIDLSNQSFGPSVIRESLYCQNKHGYKICTWDSHDSDDPVEQKEEHQIRIRHSRGGNYKSHGKISNYSSARPVLSQLPERDKEPAEARHACTSVLEMLQSIRFLDLDPDAMRQASQPGQVILGDRGEHLSSVLQGICQNPDSKNTLLSWLRSLTPMDAVDFDFETDFSGRVLVHFVEAGGHKTSAFSASDGTLRFLALAAALLSPDTGKIYFFEEFDNGIHPTRLHLLLQLVQQVCRQQHIQVIGTTHNPALLAFLDKEARNDALLIYRNEATADSKIRRIATLPEIERVLGSQDLARLHASGWLEDAAAFSEPEQTDARLPEDIRQ